MKTISSRGLAAVIALSHPILWFRFFPAIPSLAQILPDDTLPLPSQVTVEDNIYKIEGGTAAGNNLFHSFERFSVPTGAEAFFNNTDTVENILTRVTGRHISNIDGLLRANGTANLFLLNPNGIVFGENARLDIGGSFLASTAESLVFESNSEFSATAPDATPLLSVNVPMGLQFNDRAGEIQVRGRGHHLTASDPFFSQIFRNDGVFGLQVRPGRTLALVGGDVRLNGATLATESGRIELGGVGEGFVRFIVPSSTVNRPWRLNYDGVSRFRDVHLTQGSALDVRGRGVGSMQLVADEILLNHGSIALLQNQGQQTFGNLQVRAAESLTLIGTTSDGMVPTGFRQETVGAGNTGDLEISTQRLTSREGAAITSQTWGAGNAGEIDIQVSESIELIGFSSINPIARSLVTSLSFGSGSTGDITVAARNLSMIDGGSIGTATFFETGSAGNIFVTVTETIEAIGVEPMNITPSFIVSVSNSMGDAGDVTLNTSRAIVREGGRLASFTVGAGNGGRLVLNATEFVEVSGTVPGSINPSLIDAGANRVDEVLGEAFGIPPTPSGLPGSLEIHTPQLIVKDGGLVTVRNDGVGGAGSLQIDAGVILLDEGGGITASTQSGEGGNLTLRVDESLQLWGGSQITAEAGGTGNGGNLTISTDTISLLEGSSIDANAFEGRGGNIEIDTRGLFVSPDSHITASSQLGIDGLVTINEPEIDTSSALVQLSSDPIDPTTQIVSVCGIARDNSFTITGNGGLPPDPTRVLRGQDIWIDMRLSEIRELSFPVETNSREEEKNSHDPEPIVEATGWHRREDGTVELVNTRSRLRGDRLFPSNCVPFHSESRDRSIVESRAKP
ncbi:MAG: S-layer family protein [Cyanobacteria bacterium SBC]|nr:S-layer family protein [Cyanobacteria bacterium SBC]